MATIVMALAGFAHGQNPYTVNKTQLYTQTSSSGAVANSTAPYSFSAQASLINTTLHVPGGSTQAMPYVYGDNAYEVIAAFTSKGAMDAAYPNGTYTMTGAGIPTLTMNLSTDLYPTAIPQITNGTWSAGGLLVINPTQSYTFNLSTFSTYATAGVAGHESFQMETGGNTFQQEIATQAVLGLTASATPFTSVTLPAGTLTTGNVYRVEVQFDTLPTLDTTTVPGNGVISLFSNHLQLWVAALASGTAALPLPVVTTQPANKTAALGTSATFTANFNTGGAQNYRTLWYFNGAELFINSGDPKYTMGANGGAVSLTINNITSADFGSYSVMVVDTGGMATTNAATLTQGVLSTPTITLQPQGHTVATGSSVVFGVGVSGSGLTYQWKKGGVAISGATSSQYLLSNAQVSDAGSYTVTATNGAGSVTSSAALLGVLPSGDPGRLINVSVRIVSGTGSNVLIMGFVTGGAGTTGTKQLLIRGVGPTLTGFGVPGAMADPILQIIPQGATVPSVSNDNWGGDTTVLATANAVGAFALPSASSNDAALVTSLGVGVFSAKVLGANSTTGTVLAEVYDANPAVYSASTPRLINISARAPMANDNPLIAGFVVGGSTAKTVMIRAIGPFLAQYFGASAMSDPQLDLYGSGSSTVPLLTNDNWGGSALITSTGSSVGAFALTDPASKDAVLLVTLDPGVYSAKVTGVNNASGITLVEIYEIP